MYAIRLKQKVNGKYYYFYRSGQYHARLMPDCGQTWLKKPDIYSQHCFAQYLEDYFMEKFGFEDYNTLNCDFDLVKEFNVILPKDCNQWPDTRQFFDDFCEIVEIKFEEI